MKTITTILFAFALLLSLFAVSVSCSRGNDPVEETEQPNPDPDPDPDPKPEPFVLTDLVGKAAVMTFATTQRTLLFIYFTEESGKVVANSRNYADENSYECVLDGEDKAKINQTIFTVSKDNQGKITLTDVSRTDNTPIAKFVLYDAAAVPNFRTEGKLFKQNDNSYMKFSATKWGWSGTSTVTLDRDYIDTGDRPNLYFRGSSPVGEHIGIMIPAGVEWDSQTGPLLLVQRGTDAVVVFMQE